MPNFLQKLFGFLKHLISRPGMKEFLQKYEEQTFALIAQLASVNNNAAFAQWKDQAFAQLKTDTGELHDNWIAIAIHLAYEEYKARTDSGESPA